METVSRRDLRIKPIRGRRAFAFIAPAIFGREFFPVANQLIFNREDEGSHGPVV
jgi:hypothetical protein